MIRGIHHTAISTPDIDRAIAFYRDLLGFEVLVNGAWPRGAATAGPQTSEEGRTPPAGVLCASLAR